MSPKHRASEQPAYLQVLDGRIGPSWTFWIFTLQMLVLMVAIIRCS